MVNTGAQPEPSEPSSAPDQAHLILYDGVCGLCNRLLEFLLLHDHRSVFRFASLQGRVGTALVKQSGGKPGELTSFYVFADYKSRTSRVFTRSDAALFVAGQLGWPWKAAKLLGVLPRRIRDRAYDRVARNRYRVLGRHDRCLIPRPEFRNRFID
jgi:predicted DCC family thiol-disulfide oxidoreductase YuxK